MAGPFHTNLRLGHTSTMNFPAAFFTVALVAAALVKAEHVREHERKVLEKCNEDIKAPPSVIDQLLEMETLDKTREGKCLLQCAMAAFGVMKEDGSVDEEKSDAFILHAYTKPENQKRVKEIWQECQEKVEKVEDNCDHAFGLVDCFMETAKKENIPKIHEDKH